MKSSWQPIIGLEVHVELNTRAKMFCSCPSNHFGIKANKNTCPVCLGLPGALPVPNQKAIEDTILISQTFNCEVSKNFWFDRKNYFYPDLPKGYQISQQYSPIAKNGRVPILIDGKFKDILLDNIHLEEDTGKLIHRENKTLVDFNRSGVPLVEIVTRPCLRSGIEAKLYLQRLQHTLRWLEVSDCDMEKGSMRLEVNISVAKLINGKLNGLPNYKVEIKNLNSFKFVEKSIVHEVDRQIKILEKEETPKQETRGFDPDTNGTYSQRGKEIAKDYRYFPEPDIPPLEFSENKLAEIKNRLTSFPWQIEEKWLKHGIPESWIPILIQNKSLATLFEETIKEAGAQAQPKIIAKHLVNNPGLRNKSPKEIIKQIASINDQFSLSQEEIQKLVNEVLDQQPQAVSDLKSGKTQIVGFLVGQVQAKAKGKADPKKTGQIILRLTKK